MLSGAILIVGAFASYLFPNLQSWWPVLAVGGLMLIALGWADDFSGMKPRRKRRRTLNPTLLANRFSTIESPKA
jgi:UDP-N-acetylmuramyl pentapeptide phosphotransferase/UDP-N-acetylglucosamine-1-phosphate transferase